MYERRRPYHILPGRIDGGFGIHHVGVYLSIGISTFSGGWVSSCSCSALWFASFLLDNILVEVFRTPKDHKHLLKLGPCIHNYAVRIRTRVCLQTCG